MTRRRPKWAERLRFWLADGQYDHLVMGDREFPGWRVRMGDAGLAVLCFLFGHKPVADQCDKPEHDFCVYCMTPKPGLAPRESRP